MHRLYTSVEYCIGLRSDKLGIDRARSYDKNTN